MQSGAGKKSRLHDNAYNPSVMQNIDITSADAEFARSAMQQLDAIVFEGKKLAHFFVCTDVMQTKSKSRGTVTVEVIAQIINMDETANPEKLLSVILSSVLAMVPCGKNDLRGFQIWGEELDEPFYVPARVAEQNTPEVILHKFGGLAQSERFVNLFHTVLRFKLLVKRRKDLKGANREDNLCLFEAVVEGLHFLHEDNDIAVETIYELWKATSDIEKEAYDMEDVRKLQDYLSESRDIRIVVLSDDNKVLFKGPRKRRELFIKLEYDDYLPDIGHYKFVSDPRQFFKRCKFFCADCDKAVTKHPHGNSCPKTCPKCKRYGYEFPCPTNNASDSQKCGDCGITFFSQSCFDAHNARKPRGGKSVCQTYRVCVTCRYPIPLRGSRSHVCFKTGVRCQICNMQHPDGDKFCYVQPIDNKDDPRTIYCFFDAETTQETGKHICNVLVAEFLCLECVKENAEPTSADKVSKCYCSGIHKGRQVFTSFDGMNPVDDFIRYLLRKPPRGKKYTILALSHNGGKFDMHLVLERLLAQNINPSVVMQGFKMFCLTIDFDSQQKVVFKDSVNFLRAPLSALPKMFGFAEDAEKAYFPHKFNTVANLNTKLSHLPAIEYYGVDTMKEADRNRFLMWHQQFENTPFDLKHELVAYCKLDVIVLRKACIAFRQASIALSECDPFIATNTLPKFALHTFRAKHLTLDTLGCTPERGYRKHAMQSEMALRYLHCYAKLNNVTIRTAEWYDGEFKIPETNFRVDGLILDGNGNPQKALEYHGCYFHGCNRCYRDQDLLVDKKPALVLRLEDEARLKRIREFIEVDVKWQCDFEKELSLNAELKTMYDAVEIEPRMELRRDVLRGGRTEAFMYHYIPKEHETIKAADFVSMYPDVMRNNPYPIGHPDVITREKFVDNPVKALQYDGFALVRILPPEQLFPVFLHYRSRDKRLIFTLCAACAESLAVQCDHTVMEKSWVAGYTTIELKKAVELGYKILETFEVWHYKKWTKRDGRGGLFDSYVETFVKEKIQNSGWGTLTTDAEKKQFIEECERESGVKIEAEKVEYNKGKRYLSKILLNALWGKLSQRNDLTKVIFTKTAKDFDDIMDDNRLEVTDFYHVNESLDRICVKFKKGQCHDLPFTSLAVACHVTAYGRLKLYSILSSVPGQLLYCDTDSVYYVETEGDTPLATGKHLAGPKNYGIQHCSPDGSDMQAVMKIRGFKLTYEASKILVFDEMERAILKKARDGASYEGLPVPYSLITRSKNASLQNREMLKIYRPVYNKSICLQDGTIVPFGSIKDNDNS
uniref:DNA-directed DNA polymerase n=1 Tax=Panagrellus redivivus TaxID=6233 RepID=A0A7E4VQB5_PANRE